MWQDRNYRVYIASGWTLALVGTFILPFSSRLLSISTLCAPALGFFGSPSSCFLLYGGRTILSFLTTLKGVPIFFHIPTLAGSLALSCPKIVPRYVPLLCIITFLAHPVGNECLLYSCYWLIPLGLSYLSEPSIFLRSLMSTFTTHAVGSTLYLYTHETTSLFWYTLIPQVWLERLISALMLTACYYACTTTIRRARKLHLKDTPCQSL